MDEDNIISLTRGNSVGEGLNDEEHKEDSDKIPSNDQVRIDLSD
jgi:hypothetical protein